MNYSIFMSNYVLVPNDVEGFTFDLIEAKAPCIAPVDHVVYVFISRKIFVSFTKIAHAVSGERHTERSFKYI